MEMDRLQIAERDLRSFICDRLADHVCIPAEKAELAKLREAMMLIGEARLHLAQIDYHQPFTIEGKTLAA
jgi:hypothetical protein